MSQIQILDGGMGQELIRRSSYPPSALWSANVMMKEPEIVEAVHRDYIQAGAQFITLNSYSATPERLARDASEELFEPLQRTAIDIAKRAVAGSQARIAGCLSPLFGSYHPEGAPEFERCYATYLRIANLQRDSVDVFLCETMSSIKEATASTKAAKQGELPVWCALSVAEKDGARLRSGEPLSEAVDAVAQAGADAVLINCSPPEAVSQSMKLMSELDIPFGAYANGFVKADELQLGGTVDGLQVRKDLDPLKYADFCSDWVSQGATIIGGCCEVGPAHIAELARRFA